MDYTAQELFELLNDTDECPFVEAKGGHKSSHSVMETVCAFSNEPGLGGGYILMGAALDETSPFPQYKVIAVPDYDITKAGSDLRNLKEKLLLKKKGNAKATYYIAGKELNTEAKALSTQPKGLSTQLTIHIPVELIKEKELQYKYPEMINHPEQAYKTIKK